MKPFLPLVLSFLVLAFADTAFAQVPSYRETGYKGNMSYTNHLLIMNGIETSHGYMLNEHHYIGGGVGVFFLPSDGLTKTYSDVFLDYRTYIKNKKSTPIVGVQLGYLHNCNNPSKDYQDENGDWLFEKVDGFTYNKDAVELALGTGWSWTIGSKFGLTLGVNADFYFYKNPDIATTILPKISLGFEF